MAQLDVSGYYESLGYTWNSSAFGHHNWSDVYNATSSLSGGVTDVPPWGPIGFVHKTPGYGGTFLYRGVVYFDTSALPDVVYVTQVKISGLVRYHYEFITSPYDQISSHIRFIRVTDFDPVANAGTACYDFVRTHTLEYGNVFVHAGMTSWTAFESICNDYILGDINSTGDTYIGLRVSYDVPTTPPNEVGSIALFNSLVLEITYTTTAGVLTVVTLPATNITKTAATLWGEITAGQACKRGFDWGIADAMDNEWYEENGVYGLGTFSHEITSLTQDTEYCFRAKAEET